jgi:hypothetical protein
MWFNQGNMHVQYSNRVINILKITQTHMLTCYRPTMEQSGLGALERPRGRACSRTCTILMTSTHHARSDEHRAGGPRRARILYYGLGQYFITTILKYNVKTLHRTELLQRTRPSAMARLPRNVNPQAATPQQLKI